MAKYTILAVALGDSKALPTNKSRVIKDSSTASLLGVRPYIIGLINWLNRKPDIPNRPTNPFPQYQIGDANQYVIDYRECTEGELKDNFTVSAGLPTDFVILCMSTAVAREAKKITLGMKTPPPVVAIVSDPSTEGFPNNFCGVSAHRPDHVLECYNQFKSVVKKMYALNKKGYDPSEKSLLKLGTNVTPVHVQPNSNNATIQGIIQNINPPPQSGLLVLPADLFFGAAEHIAIWAQAQPPGLQDFWTVPDWPPNSIGGYGFPQETCGQYLAERIANIWSDNGAIPSNPPFTSVDDDCIKRKPSVTWWQRLKALFGI